MTRTDRARGFSLIELMLVIAVIGILSTIAIPSFLGQRRRARVIGDAQTNARVLAMALETRKADNGIYGTGGPFTWTVAAGASDATFLPTVALQGASKMDYSVAITNGGLAYTITVTDPSMTNANVLTLNQLGTLTLDATYNK